MELLGLLSLRHWRIASPPDEATWESGAGLLARTEPTSGDRLKDHRERQEGIRLDYAARSIAAHGFDSVDAGTSLVASHGLESTPPTGLRGVEIGRAHV